MKKNDFHFTKQILIKYYIENMKLIFGVLIILTLFGNEVVTLKTKNLKKLNKAINKEYVYYKKKILD